MLFVGLNDLENNLIAILFYQYCDVFLKLFIFIINQRHTINHCIVCSVGHVSSVVISLLLGYNTNRITLL